MKIGIMSMQRVINYGSFLQSYALKSILESMGYEVEFIDFVVEDTLIKAESPEKNSFLIRLYYKLQVVMKRAKARLTGKKISSFKNFVKRYKNEYMPILSVTSELNLYPKKDVLVIGSDEVFNCLQPGDNIGFSRELFGKHANADTIISYAASFGNTTLKGLQKYGIDLEISELLQQFHAISVRDQNSLYIVEKMTGKIPEKNLDPVLIYDYEKELKDIKNPVKESQYIVVYAYGERISKEEAKVIRAFAKKKNAVLVALGGIQYFCDYCLFPSPFELLAIIRDASYVITDTFHGSVFSIKYNKQFGVFVRYGEEQEYGNSQKLLDLLHTFQLEDRRISVPECLQKVVTTPINFQYVNKKIEDEKKHTMEYLEKNIIGKG